MKKYRGKYGVNPDEFDQNDERLRGYNIVRNEGGKIVFMMR